MSDYISREAAIEAIERNAYRHTYIEQIIDIIKQLPSAQPGPQLTADDIETIRIHLNAIKENLCNQWRHKEAEEYEEIIKRLTSLPSAQPDIIRCKDCKYRDADDFCTGRGYPNVLVPDDGFCDKGERRTDG